MKIRHIVFLMSVEVCVFKKRALKRRSQKSDFYVDKDRELMKDNSDIIVAWALRWLGSSVIQAQWSFLNLWLNSFSFWGLLVCQPCCKIPLQLLAGGDRDSKQTNTHTHTLLIVDTYRRHTYTHANGCSVSSCFFHFFVFLTFWPGAPVGTPCLTSIFV